MDTLTPSSTDTEIIDAFNKGANHYSIAESTRLSLEEVTAVIDKAFEDKQLGTPTETDNNPVDVTPVVPVTPEPVVSAPVESTPAPEAPVEPVVSEPVVSEVTPQA